MSAYKIHSLPKTSEILFGEAPIWDERHNSLVLVDCFGKSICRFYPKTGELESRAVHFEDDSFPYIIFAIPYESSPQGSKYAIGLSSTKIVEFDWELGQGTRKGLLYDANEPRMVLSDGKCDLKGRLWAGTVIPDKEGLQKGEFKFEQDKGELLRFSKSQNPATLEVSIRASSFDCPNGLGFNKENTKLYLVDASKRIIDVFDFNGDEGTVSNRKIFFSFDNHDDILESSWMPDGLTLDINGNVWVACYKGGCILKIDGVTGKLVEKIDIPATCTTSLCFGGDQYERLFVTTAQINFDGSSVIGEVDAGKLFELSHSKDNSFKGFPLFFCNF